MPADDIAPCPHPNLDDFTELDNPNDLCLACLIRIHDAICPTHFSTDRPSSNLRSLTFRTHCLELLELGN